MVVQIRSRVKSTSRLSSSSAGLLSDYGEIKKLERPLCCTTIEAALGRPLASRLGASSGYQNRAIEGV